MDAGGRRTHTGTERIKNRSRDCAYMQLRAARSLWMKFLPLRYSIPRAMSVMNFTSIWDGRYCRTHSQRGDKQFILCTVGGSRVHLFMDVRWVWTECSLLHILTATSEKKDSAPLFSECLLNSWTFQHSVKILFSLGSWWSTGTYCVFTHWIQKPLQPLINKTARSNDWLLSCVFMISESTCCQCSVGGDWVISNLCWTLDPVLLTDTHVNLFTLNPSSC